MSDSEILLKAAINRIAARLTEKLINSAQEFTEIAEELPQKLQNEWYSFKEEVIEESERLEKKSNESKEKSSEKQLSKEDLIQIQIDNLRSKVIDFNKDKKLQDDHFKDCEDVITSRILRLRGLEPNINLGGNVDSYNRYISNPERLSIFSCFNYFS